MPDPHLTRYPLHCSGCGRAYTRAEFLALPEHHPPHWHPWGCLRSAACLCGEWTVVSREGPQAGPVVDLGGEMSVAGQIEMFGGGR